MPTLGKLRGQGYKTPSQREATKDKSVIQKSIAMRQTPTPDKPWDISPKKKSHNRNYREE